MRSNRNVGSFDPIDRPAPLGHSTSVLHSLACLQSGGMLDCTGRKNFAIKIMPLNINIIEILSINAQVQDYFPLTKYVQKKVYR